MHLPTHLRWLVVVAFLSLTGCTEPTPQPVTHTQCEGTFDNSLPILTQGFTFNASNTRNQWLSQIDSSNIDQLSLKYTFVESADDIRRGAPAATEQTIFFTSQRRAYAMDSETGCIHWSYTRDNERIRSAAILLVDEEQLDRRLMIIGTAHGNVVALDSHTGEVVWDVYAGSVVNGRKSPTSQITGGLQYANGKVFVPVATEEVAFAVAQPLCCSSHGALTVLDSSSGERLWTYETTDNAKLQIDVGRFGPNGVSIWSTPLIDSDRNQVLVGTSQNLTKPLTANSDAVVALDIDSGEVNWMFKGTAEDYYNSTCGIEGLPFKHCDSPTFDFDMITPILVTTASGDDRIIAGDKSGTVYSLNPVDGELIWHEAIGVGGLLGGIHWAMTTDADKVYAGVTDFSVPKASILDGLFGTETFDVTPYLVENAQPGLYALNLETGERIWQIHDTHDYHGEEFDTLYSAGLTLSNDLLFAGSLDGVLKAFHRDTGEELWQFDSNIDLVDVHGNEGEGGTIDSVGAVIAGDKLLLNSGYNIFVIGGESEYQAGPGNALFVFSLDNE